MNSLDSPSDLPDTVERLAASVVGLATRRHRSSNAGTRLLSFIVFPPKDLIRLARAVPLE